MNHLAHALLAAPGDDRMLGSLVADFLRGGIDPSLPAGVREGIALHRSVDAWTDAHPEVVAARALFERPYRRYAGILVDIWFDHLLARDWPRHADGALPDFSRQVQALLLERAADLPPRMRGFAAYLHANDLPAAYARRTVIGSVFEGVSQRLSRANPVGSALPAIEAVAAPLQRHFEAFFPALVQQASRERERLQGDLNRGGP
jgi:acyl carrier protein phosphodiesterase